jgi:7-carboxy-7-deazaguanine synthase
MGRYAVSHCVPTFVEGGQLAGKRVIHVGLTGCQLWTGYPTQREQTGASCAAFCDAILRGGQVLDLEQLLDAIAKAAVTNGITTTSTVWFAGGEPTQQMDQALIYALKEDGWSIAIETNGLRSIEWMRAYLDHVRLSPKDTFPLEVKVASEVFALAWMAGPEPELLQHWEDTLVAHAFYLTPIDPIVHDDNTEILTLLRHGEGQDEAVAKAARFQFESAVQNVYRLIEQRPKWRIALPSNRLLGLEW